MNRQKSELASVAIDSDGTARGILLADVVTDLGLMWPKYRRVGLLGPGREWKVIGCASGLGGTITVQGGVQSSGNANDFVLAGDTLNLTRVKASEQFTSTPLTVTNVATAFVSGAYRITFTFAGTVPSLSLDGYDFVNTALIRTASWQTWPILSHTTGANADVVISATTGQLSAVPDVALCDCDIFKCQDLVQVTGSGNAANNTIFECRSDMTDNTTTFTVHLDGYLNAVSSGGAGSITLLLPTPLRVVATARAVLRAHSITLSKGHVVRVRRNDEEQDWWEIQHVADLGPPQWFNPITP